MDEAIEQLERGNHEWCRLITESSPEIAKREEELYEEYTNEDDVTNFVVTEDKAKILRGIIDIRMAPCVAKVREETPTTVCVNEQPFRMKLPQLSLPTYSGDPKGWMEFWKRFSSAVDAVNIPATQKFTYLLSCLQESAYAAIAGMAITSVNYDSAIQMLKRRFGDKKLIKTALNQQLSDIRCAGPQLKDLRASVNMIDKTCNQLTTYGEDVNHPSIVAQIERKLPPGIPIKLEEAKLVSLGWNVNIMREKLHELIRLRERAYTATEYRSGKKDWNILEPRQRPIIQPVKSSFNQSTKENNKNLKFSYAFFRGDY